MRVDDRVLNQTFGGTNSIQFLVQTPAADGIKDPRVLKGMERLQAFLETQQDVGKTQSLVDLIKRMNQAMHADEKAYCSVPDSQELVAQYLFLYSSPATRRTSTAWWTTTTGAPRYGRSSRTTAPPTPTGSPSGRNAIIDESFPPGVTVQMGGSLPQLIALNDVIVSDKIRNMAQMAVVVFVLGAIILRSLVGGLFVVTPLFAVMLANFGLMGWRARRSTFRP